MQTIWFHQLSSIRIMIKTLVLTIRVRLGMPSTRLSTNKEVNYNTLCAFGYTLKI